MAHAKRKSKSHIIDDKAISIIKAILPNFWEIREYAPDYGIDLAVEIFEKSKESIDCFDTLGEHFFVQVKGQEKVNHMSYNIYNDNNEIYKTIDVITFSLDTNLIYTVQKMSSAVPVMLFVVDISNDNIFFVNLNDYIDNVLLKEQHNYTKQKTKTIYIPTHNIISITHQNFSPLEFYAKRPKLYSFFSKLTLTYAELKYTDAKQIPAYSLFHASNLLALDIFNYCDRVPFLELYKNTLSSIITLADNFFHIQMEDSNVEKNWDYLGELFTHQGVQILIKIQSYWDCLITSKNIYEDDYRNCYLPTYSNYLRLS